MNEANNGWNEYQNLVLNELKRHNELIEDLREEIGLVKTEIATLKVKSGIWGFAAGAIPLIIYLTKDVLLASAAQSTK